MQEDLIKRKKKRKNEEGNVKQEALFNQTMLTKK